MDNDDDIDYTGIPDFAPDTKSQWAKGPPQLITDISQLRDLYVPKITRESIINQLYIEAMDRRSKNQPARIMALKLIAELKGYTTSGEDVKEELTDNLTHDEITKIAQEFNTTY